MSQQPQTTTLAELKKPMPPVDPTIRAGFDTVGGFELIQRTAKLFAASDIVPEQFKGNLPNCVIAVDMALRMGANPLMVCQNLYIVHGRPAWSAQFLIATLNQCGRFSSIRYEFQGEEGKDEWGCRAVATELATGEKLVGPLITIEMAKKSGWYNKKDKNGKEASKWPLMPEQMLRLIEQQEKIAKDAATLYRDGKEEREIFCDCLKDWNTFEMVWTEAEPPYAEVRRRPMTPEEKRPSLLDYDHKPESSEVAKAADAAKDLEREPAECLEVQ